MKQRITRAIVGVTAFVLIALGIPLALVIRTSIIGSEVVELHAASSHTLNEIHLPLDPTQLAKLAHEHDAPPPFAVYTPDGHLFFGNGPPQSDAITIQAGLTGQTTSSTTDHIVVSAAITDTNERIVGVLRISESLQEANTRTRQAWAAMAAAALGALGVAWLLARRLANRLTHPIAQLVVASRRLADGGRMPGMGTTGIDEIDVLGSTLTRSAQQLVDALSRERRFSADVSHQLRTPLTGIRLRLEASHQHEETRRLAATTLADISRIESTVAHLLDHARDLSPPTSATQIEVAINAALERWASRFAAEDRRLTATITTTHTVAASATSLDQVLDVLCDNARKHGRGAVTLTARSTTSGTAIDVTDEGSIPVDRSDEQLFQRGHGTDNGIGLALARSIIEAEGGRLIISNRDPTTFTMFVLQLASADD